MTIQSCKTTRNDKKPEQGAPSFPLSATQWGMRDGERRGTFRFGVRCSMFFCVPLRSFAAISPSSICVHLRLISGSLPDPDFGVRHWMFDPPFSHVVFLGVFVPWWFSPPSRPDGSPFEIGSLFLMSDALMFDIRRPCSVMCAFWPFLGDQRFFWPLPVLFRG